MGLPATWFPLETAALFIKLCRADYYYGCLWIISWRWLIERIIHNLELMRKNLVSSSTCSSFFFAPPPRRVSAVCATPVLHFQHQHLSWPTLSISPLSIPFSLLSSDSPFISWPRGFSIPSSLSSLSSPDAECLRGWGEETRLRVVRAMFSMMCVTDASALLTIISCGKFLELSYFPNVLVNQ